MANTLSKATLKIIDLEILRVISNNLKHKESISFKAHRLQLTALCEKKKTNDRNEWNIGKVQEIA